MRVKLCDVTSYSKGIQINGDELVDDGKYYYINGGINPSGKWNSYNVYGNTITISEGGNSSGYINYIDEPFWCGAHCYYLYDGPKNTRYLYYALKSQQKRMFDIRSGACMPNIKKSDLGNFEFEFEQDEQKQENITSILFTVETIIQVYNKELKFLKELVKARFIELFGDIKLNEKQFPIKKLNEISQYWNGLTYKPENVVKNEKDGTLVLRSSNIQNGSLCFDDNVYVNCMIKEKQYVKENDILMCSRNGSARLVGKTALIKGLNKPTSFGAFMMIIRSDYYPYLKIFFEMDSFKKQISTGTSTINQITVKMLNQVELPVPSMNFVYEFNQFCKQVDKSRYVSGFYKYIKHK